MHGLCVVDKPAGVTSHDVVSMLRKRLGEKRIGHSGTLDPDATGVLLCGIGNLTRFLRFLTDLPKTYTAEVVLGTETSTLDASGEVTATHDMAPPTIEAVRAVVAARLTGPILQVPPMVSALKVDGVRLHEMARAGIEIDREARPVTIHRFDIDSTPDPMVLAIDVQCSSGTYVRTLAADLGHHLGGGAHLRNLRRTAIGSFLASEAATPDDAPILTMAEGLRDYATWVVDADTAKGIGQGRRYPAPDDGSGPWVALDGDGNVLAMYERHGTSIHPAVVVPVEAPPPK
jgi:tRNA pseudouridine55 synthase